MTTERQSYEKGALLCVPCETIGGEMDVERAETGAGFKLLVCRDPERCERMRKSRLAQREAR